MDHRSALFAACSLKWDDDGHLVLNDDPLDDWHNRPGLAPGRDRYLQRRERHPARHILAMDEGQPPSTS